VKKLLKEGGANVRAKDRDGRSGFSLAKQRNNTQVLNFLRQVGVTE